MDTGAKADLNALWPPLRRLADGTPCWCVVWAPDWPEHERACNARRNDRVLVIDDVRRFKFPATYARSVWEAEILLFRPDGWDEVWWDHDMSLDGVAWDAPSRSGSTRGLAERLEHMAIHSEVPRCGRVVIHTANPDGRDWLAAALGHVYGRVEIVDANDWLG